MAARNHRAGLLIWTAAAILAGAHLAACEGDGDDGAGAPGIGGADGAADAAPDTGPAPDAAPDTGPAPDGAPDGAPDAAPDTGPVTPAAGLAIVGSYVDDFDFAHEITQATWTQGVGADASAFHVATYDNDAGTLIAHNDAANAWSPDLWSRFDWTWVDGVLWYCQGAFDAPTEADALATPAADAADPAHGGCGGFAWSRLTLAPLAIAGAYVDDFGFAQVVAADAWAQGEGAEASLFHVARYSNVDRWLVAQNDAANAWSAGLWSRFDWTSAEDTLWYCQSLFDAPDLAAVLDAPAPDTSQPATAGCGGFAWSRLTPAAEPELLAIIGSYVDAFGFAHEITAETWTQGAAPDQSVFHIGQFSNDAGWLVAQNDAANAWSPGLWSRFDWSWQQDDLWYCQSLFDGASEDAALAATPADPSDPATTGCGGFAWSNLTP